MSTVDKRRYRQQAKDAERAEPKGMRLGCSTGLPQEHMDIEISCK